MGVAVFVPCGSRRLIGMVIPATISPVASRWFVMPAYPLVIIIATASILGALVGCLTGLVPGLHSNNAASFIGSRPGLLLMVAGLGMLTTDDPGWALVASSAVVACAVAHTIANIVPSIYLAIPEGDTALSVLPGHRMVMAGRGEEALRVSVTSSIASVGKSPV